MRLMVFSIFDAASQAYARPFYEQTKALAIRSFREACNTKDSALYKYSTDFSLVLLGSFDDGGAVFETHAPERVISASELIVDDV